MGILTIDDRDPLLSYSPSGAWGQGGVSNEYNSTTTFAKAVGSTATLTFSGTSVNVYGTLAPLISGEDGPQTSYSVDNGSPTTFAGKLANAVQYEQRFFGSGALSPGSHTLTITLLSPNSTYFIDYIQVVPLDMPVVSTSSSASSSSSSSSTAARITSVSTTTTISSSIRTTASLTTTSSNTSSPTTSQKPSEASSSPSHISTIVGWSLGALAFVIFIFFAILLVRKRRKDRKFRKILDSQNVTNQSLWTRYTPPHSGSSITPFITTRYQPVNNDAQLELVDNPTTGSERLMPYRGSPMLPQRDLAPPSLTSKGISHSHSPSQNSIRSQDSRMNISTASGGASSSSNVNQASLSSRPAAHTPVVYTNPFDLPPPRYDD